MSKTSAKNRYMQLMEWLPTLKTYGKRRKKRAQTRMEYIKEKRGY